MQSGKQLTTIITTIISFAILCQQRGFAQTNPNTSQQALKPAVKYLLPNGLVIGPEKLDSVKQVWGADRVMMKHIDADDAKGIVHLEQLTDEMTAHQFRYQALVKANDAIAAYKIHNYPTHLVIDKSGILREYYAASADTFNLLSAAIDKSL